VGKNWDLLDLVGHMDESGFEYGMRGDGGWINDFS
jgi:hypothetical protein